MSLFTVRLQRLLLWIQYLNVNKPQAMPCLCQGPGLLFQVFSKFLCIFHCLCLCFYPFFFMARSYTCVSSLTGIGIELTAEKNIKKYKFRRSWICMQSILNTFPDRVGPIQQLFWTINPKLCSQHRDVLEKSWNWCSIGNMKVECQYISDSSNLSFHDYGIDIRYLILFDIHSKIGSRYLNAKFIPETCEFACIIIMLGGN